MTFIVFFSKFVHRTFCSFFKTLKNRKDYGKVFHSLILLEGSQLHSCICSEIKLHIFFTKTFCKVLGFWVEIGNHEQPKVLNHGLYFFNFIYPKSCFINKNWSDTEIYAQKRVLCIFIPKGKLTKTCESTQGAGDTHTLSRKDGKSYVVWDVVIRVFWTLMEITKRLL